MTDTMQSDNSTKKNHEDFPSPLHYLFESDARQILADYFITLGTQWDEDDDPLMKQEIIDQTGLTRKAVIEHIDALIALGIVGVTDGDGWDRYYPNVENDAFWQVLEANNALFENWQRYEQQQADENADEDADS